MPALAALLLVPRIVLPPPEAPSPLADVAEACAAAVAASPALEVIRLAPTPSSPDLALRVRAELDAGATAYRQLRFRDAVPRLVNAIEVLSTEATQSADFEALADARIRLGMALQASHRQGPAREAFLAAARLAPDRRLSESDYSPAVIAAYDEARASLSAPVPLILDVRASVEGVSATVLVDGRAVVGSSVALVPGEHVVYAAAPGHTPVREVVRIPRPQALRVRLASSPEVASGLVVGLRLASSTRGVRISLEPAGMEALGDETERAGAVALARTLASRLAQRIAGGPALASGAERSEDTPVTARATTARERGSPHPPARREQPSGSVLGQWWFWTIVGSVAVVGVLGAAAASRRDAGTDVRVGLQ